MSTKQLFIGMGGGTGSGKTTVVEAVMARLRPLNVHLIRQDKFFKPVDQLPTYYSDFWQKPCPDFNRPDSLRLEALEEVCTAVSGYDVVLLEGILVLYFPQLRQLMDIKCYVETPLEEMLVRRTQRNLAAGYGGPFEEIAHYNLECVTPQHRRYNHPTKRFADVVIPNGMHEGLEHEAALQLLEKMIREKTLTPALSQGEREQEPSLMGEG